MPESLHDPVPLIQTPYLSNRKAHCSPKDRHTHTNTRQDIGLVDTVKFHEQPKVFSEAGTMYMQDKSTVHPWSSKNILDLQCCSAGATGKKKELYDVRCH